MAEASNGWTLRRLTSAGVAPIGLALIADRPKSLHDEGSERAGS